MKKAYTRIRTIYVNSRDELYLQFYPQNVSELNQVQAGFVSEPLQSGHVASGYLTKVLTSGICLRDWRIV